MTIGDLICGDHDFDAHFRVVCHDGSDIKTVYDTTKTAEFMPLELCEKVIDYIDCIDGVIEIGYWN